MYANKLDKMSRRVQGAAERLSQQLDKVEELQDEVVSMLLNARISSKLWWLMLQNKKEEHDTYQGKAKRFVSRQRDEARKARARRKETRSGRHSQAREGQKTIKRPCKNKHSKKK